MANRVERLDIFERYLSLWVVLCMVTGVGLGKLLPGFTDLVRRLEIGDGSQINLAIAVLVWLMVYPMMLKIDLGSLAAVRHRPRGILVVLFVNWLFTMLCYHCQKSPPTGGLRLGVRQAVGICHDCGVAVCSQHGEKEPGQPLLCGECSEARRTTGGASPGRAA